MIQKLLASLTASVRDVILAGVAAGVGYLLAVEVIPKTTTELKVILAGALYAILRAIVGKLAELLS